MKDFIRLIIVTLIFIAAYFVYSTFFVEEEPDMTKPEMQISGDTEPQPAMDVSGLSAVGDDEE